MGIDKPIRDNRHGLFHFVALTGATGAAWVSAYRGHEVMELTRISEQSVHLMRRGELETAAAELRRVAARRPAIADASSTYATVLDRFYFGALAYLSYCQGDLDSADRTLVQASAAIEHSIQLCRGLFPFAHQRVELRLQRARISRNRLRWDEMSDHVQACEAMVDGTAPLCLMADGSPLDYREMARLYRDECQVDPRHPVFSGMLDLAHRQRTLCGTLRFIYAHNETVIRYP